MSSYFLEIPCCRPFPQSVSSLLEIGICFACKPIISKFKLYRKLSTSRLLEYKKWRLIKTQKIESDVWFKKGMFILAESPGLQQLGKTNTNGNYSFSKFVYLVVTDVLSWVRLSYISSWASLMIDTGRRNSTDVPRNLRLPTASKKSTKNSLSEGPDPNILMICKNKNKK